MEFNDRRKGAAQPKGFTGPRFKIQETDNGHVFIDRKSGKKTPAEKLVPGLGRKPTGFSSSNKAYDKYQSKLKGKLSELNKGDNNA